MTDYPRHYTRTPVRQSLLYFGAFNWVRRGAKEHLGIVFTAQLPDRFLDCWRDTRGKQHIQTRQRSDK